MPATPHASRRTLLAGLFAAGAATARPARPRLVTILGDSITAGYGLAADDALPAQLARALAALGTPATVRGAGVSGDTTAGGLARLEFSVQPDTELCLVALGGNDLLQGIDPRVTRANLTRILLRLKARHMAAILAGIAAPAAIGAAYARDFDAAFPAAARAAGGVPLYPDLLAGVGRDPRLNQRDGIHPNPAGAAIIARRLAPLVARTLRGRL